MAETVDRKGSYHVLRERKNAGVATYEPVAASVEASSVDGALKKAVKETGVYLAIPSRSFNPVAVTVSTETVVKLAEGP